MIGGTGMRRTVVTAMAATAALLAPPAFGGGVERGFENEYSGTVKGNNHNYFGFDVEGKKAVKIGATLYYPGDCGGDPYAYQSNDKLAIEHGRFKGTVTGTTTYDYKYKVTGRIKPGGKASGRITAILDGSGLSCHYPKSKWTASKTT
jgi:hypothetical protein